MEIPANYNLLLGRPWIHMAGAVPFLLHQSVKFVWEGEEVVIHGEASMHNYPDNSVPVIEAAPKGTDFHVMELVGAAHKIDSLEALMPAVYKMIASTMILNWFEPRRAEEEIPTKKKQEVVDLHKPIPNLYQSFPHRMPIPGDTDIEEGIRMLFQEEDCFVILEIYHEILMDREDVEKIAFITPWGVYHYRIMPFGLKNAGATRRGIELDPIKIKAIQELPPPQTKKEVVSFLGRLNYIGRFIAQSTIIVEPILELLKKNAPTKWIEECQEAFDTIKRYLSNPPVLVPPRPGSPLLLYLSVVEKAFGCMLRQHDEEGKRERAIYYLSKKFTAYEARYILVEKTYCALNWVAQKLRHYLSSYTTHFISKTDSLRYIFHQPMPVGKLAKWQMLFCEFDIVYIAQKAVKGQDLADLLAASPVDEELEPLHTHFPDQRVLAIEEGQTESYTGWKLFFDGAVNYKGSEIGAVLISENGKHYPMDAKLKFHCTNNTAKYEACIIGLRMALDIDINKLLVIGDSDLLIHQVQGEWATKNENILPYVNLAQRLCKKFRKIEF
ncbi:uncharacterized protein LOC132601488 [Lycium barbarum]|uniref:uncharacterized protein LOC132601488 n=1 Tax=Lycium barbarum TaxID=112863 RepID=UPI00293F6FB5|nr:uncharacterized protein LOC132601488 [Lycium barbarum]